METYTKSIAKRSGLEIRTNGHTPGNVLPNSKWYDLYNEFYEYDSRVVKVNLFMFFCKRFKKTSGIIIFGE